MKTMGHSGVAGHIDAESPAINERTAGQNI